MAIYDVNGNVISSGGGGDSFFIEENVHNLLGVDLSKFVPGVLNNNSGAVTSNSNYITSDYVSIPDGYTTVYRLSAYEEYNLQSLAGYDATKQFLGMATTASYDYDYYDKNGNRFFYLEFSLPSGTKYVRTSVYKDVTEVYITTDAITTPFDINETTVIASEPVKMYEALGIPKLTNIKRFEGKTIIVAGDSIVESNATCNKNPWCNMVANELGMTLYNDGQGGTGWAKNYYQRGCTVYRIENNWSSLYPAEPDVILVMGNMNDGTGGGGGYSQLNPDWEGTSYMPVGTKDDASTTLSCYTITKRLIEDLITQYPKAKIGIVSSTPRSYTNTHFAETQSYGHGWFEGYIEAHKYWCEEYGIPYLDLYHENPCLRPWVNGNATEYFYDAAEVDGYMTGVHPNETGHLHGIAYPVLQWMLTWM